MAGLRATLAMPKSRGLEEGKKRKKKKRKKKQRRRRSRHSRRRFCGVAKWRSSKTQRTVRETEEGYGDVGKRTKPREFLRSIVAHIVDQSGPSGRCIDWRKDDSWRISGEGGDEEDRSWDDPCKRVISADTSLLRNRASRQSI
ncbi:hypothetical protein KM043_007588 [Ampulex compressa]|nr:hypothetical protein KM043_007588 [Ampulex compressa]